MKAIEIIMLPVTDQQKAKEFYLNLGFQVIMEAPAAHGETWLQMGLPGQNVSIALMTFHGIICETPNIEKEIGDFKKKGIEFGKVDETPWGRFAWVKDPSGNSICLRQREM